MDTEIVCQVSAQPPFVPRKRPERESRGVHAEVAQALMKKPGKWLLISFPKRKPLSKERRSSLAASLHGGSLFGHQFQVRVYEGHTYARYVAD